jgi:mycoredoxin
MSEASPPTVTVYSTEWCGDCHRSKRLLDRLDVAYTSIDVEQDDVMRDRAIAIAGRQAVPVIVLPDGSHLVEPTDPELEGQLRALGLVDGTA